MEGWMDLSWNWSRLKFKGSLLSNEANIEVALDDTELPILHHLPWQVFYFYILLKLDFIIPCNILWIFGFESNSLYEKICYESIYLYEWNA